jgi:hypothetical protein
VPGHNTKFSLVNYIKDDQLVIGGIKVMTKVLEVKMGNFPGFDYYLLKAVS